MGEGERGGEERAIWEGVRQELRDSLPTATFDLWIEPLRAVGSEAEAIYVTGPARVRTWVERRYIGPLETALRRLAPGLERIVLVEAPATGGADGGQAGSRVAEPLPVDPRHTFDRFVIGPENRFAHAAALAVAESPGEAYNPLFLHGPPGLGKTHLLGAIADYLRCQYPSLSVHHTTAERFTTEFVAALRAEGPERFKQRYRALDALLIDDVQILEGKPRTEEEFVHTFNALFTAGKQIVLSSDRPPGALSRLEERLRDRFAWGLTVPIEPPDLRTRIALLWRFAGDAVDQLPDPEPLREIAARAPGNVRLLEGALTRVLAFSSVFGEPLARGAVDRALARHTPLRSADDASGDLAPSIEAIQDAVGSVLGLTRSELLSPSRTPRIARARQLAMFLCRELTPLPLAQIARAFDRDHSTVIHAVRVVEQRNEPGSDTAGQINSIRFALGKLAADAPRHRPPINPDPPDPQP
ncbi:MAG: chromosomal replication initiator protein DnaA [Actinomycetota bacterium]|nr:chromosomal replication initiator protein DnaA [Actinomycetota bacterium]